MDLCFRGIEAVCTHVCVSVQVVKRKELIKDYFLSFFPFSPLSLIPNLFITISRSLKK